LFGSIHDQFPEFEGLVLSHTIPVMQPSVPLRAPIIIIKRNNNTREHHPAITTMYSTMVLQLSLLYTAFSVVCMPVTIPLENHTQVQAHHSCSSSSGINFPFSAYAQERWSRVKPILVS
jgi:hypothetical protein